VVAVAVVVAVSESDVSVASVISCLAGWQDASMISAKSAEMTDTKRLFAADMVYLLEMSVI
jgi:NADPH-dependent curcumin reductase CurA